MNTPRTDAACFDSFEHPLTHQNCEVVKADFCRQLERELIAINAEHQKFACHGETLSDTLTRIMGAANKYERELIAEQEKVRELREALQLTYDHARCYWHEIEFNNVGEYARAILEKTK